MFICSVVPSSLPLITSPRFGGQATEKSRAVKTGMNQLCTPVSPRFGVRATENSRALKTGMNQLCTPVSPRFGVQATENSRALKTGMNQLCTPVAPKFGVVTEKSRNLMIGMNKLCTPVSPRLQVLSSPIMGRYNGHGRGPRGTCFAMSGQGDTNSFSDELPIYKMLVFTHCSAEKGVSKIYIHGMWPCNKLDGKLVFLRNEEQVSVKFFNEICRMVKSKVGEEFKKKYWRPFYGDSTKFMIYECKTHNIYQNKILNLNYCNDVVRLSSKFLEEEGSYNLSQLMIKFTKELAKEVMKRTMTNRDAMKLLKRMAKKTYGVDVKVENMKDPVYHIKIAFLLDPQDQLIDNEKSYFSNIDLKL